MENERPAYYANIPASVRYDNRLSPNAKLLYGEITALCNKEGFCWASNKYFADLYDVASGTISEWIRKLVECEHVYYKIIDRNTRQVFLKGVSGNPEGGIRKSRRGVSGKAEHNTTVNNTKNTTPNSEATASPKCDPLGAEIIKAFEVVNPACSRMYGNTTQRKACDDLIATYGLEQVLKIIELLPQTNGREFFPNITTPLLLRDKWVSLGNAMRRQNEKHTKTNCIIL